MAIILKKADFSKNGWQEHRNSALKGCGMGKALEAFKAYYIQGADGVNRSGKTNDAVAKATMVSKAIGLAKRKAADIKDATKKRDTKLLLEAYEKEIAEFNDALLSSDYAAKCSEAVEEVVRSYKNEGVEKLKDVKKLIDMATAALKKRDASAAGKNHGAALNKLKGVTVLATKTGLSKFVANTASAKGVAAKDVNLGDARIKNAFSEVSKTYTEYTKLLEDMATWIEKFDDQLANKEPETDPQASKEHKANLKKLMNLYKGVVDDAKRDLAKVKKSNSDIAKLTAILAKTSQGTADALVQAVVKVFKGMKDSYHSMDSNIQATIRTDKSTYNVQAKEWGISADDKAKNTMPLMNRAFAVNFQAKGLFENGTEKLIDILDVLANKHGSDLAKRAASELRKG